ncbi:hypothetical protein F3Y22_tig00113725pilonHSYRG00412 [Hibiscus syriacus]|uniref:RNase H type-1 domain-containing protein n=1 Tax=Hibiscus syriacus TaxID=106335 RepID=A0A6A2XY71_HIBSY|nr:hypothetical protein F3Y22_tig00113725pilonHSYRG00412 [Hibiscus syriacus]
MILRDEVGSVLGSFQEAAGLGPPTLMELKAIKQGLIFFDSFRWCFKKYLIIESDSKLSVEWVKNLDKCPYVFVTIVNDIVDRLRVLEGLIRRVARTTNIKADGVAKSGALLLEEVATCCGEEGIDAIISAAVPQHEMSMKVLPFFVLQEYMNIPFFMLVCLYQLLSFPLCSGILEHFLHAAMKTIGMDIPPAVKVGACPALSQLLPEANKSTIQLQMMGLLSSLTDLFHQASDETLHLVLETQQAAIKAGGNPYVMVIPLGPFLWLSFGKSGSKEMIMFLMVSLSKQIQLSIVVIAGFYKEYRDNIDLTCGALEHLRRSIYFTEPRHSQAWIQSDCSRALKLVEDGGAIDSHIPLLRANMNLRQYGTWTTKIQWIPRNGNRIADRMEKLASWQHFRMVHFDSPPDELADHLGLEAAIAQQEDETSLT